MSILDTGDIASSAITGFSQNPIANLSSGVGEAGIASLVEGLFPQLSLHNSNVVIGRTAIAGTGRWRPPRSTRSPVPSGAAPSTVACGFWGCIRARCSRTRRSI